MPIILTGFMGVGKTTVGRILAEALNVPFIDMDTYIEAQEGKTIATIFDQIGESGFRQLEFQVLESLLETSNNEKLVISTGGGIIETAECRNILKRQPYVFYLKDTFETSWYRINRGGRKGADRPLVKANTSSQMLAKFNRRIPLYEEASNFILDVQKSDAYQTAQTIQTYL